MLTERKLVVVLFPSTIEIYREGFNGGLGEHVVSVPKQYRPPTKDELRQSIFEAVPSQFRKLLPAEWQVQSNQTK